MVNSNYMVSSLPGDRENMSRRFEDYSASIQQIIHCIETVEAQLRDKRQEIEDIKVRQEALAKELATAISGLAGIVSAPAMLPDDTPTLLASEDQASRDQSYVAEPVGYNQEKAGEEVDPQSVKVGVMRVFEKKRRSAADPETNA